MTNPVSPVSAEELLDDDGENLAVRAFLSLYGCTNVPSTDQMRRHLVASGFDECWPDWATADQYLSTSGAQAWIRHLFALERAPAASGAVSTGEVINHEEALQLAHLRKHESNLARCYIDLATAASGATPEGYALVPVEPDLFMKQAVLEHSRSNGSYLGNACNELWIAQQVYRAMIAAATLPPNTNQNEVKS